VRTRWEVADQTRPDRGPDPPPLPRVGQKGPGGGCLVICDPYVSSLGLRAPGLRPRSVTHGRGALPHRSPGKCLKNVAALFSADLTPPHTSAGRGFSLSLSLSLSLSRVPRRPPSRPPSRLIRASCTPVHRARKACRGAAAIGSAPGGAGVGLGGRDVTWMFESHIRQIQVVCGRRWQ